MIRQRATGQGSTIRELATDNRVPIAKGSSFAKKSAKHPQSRLSLLWYIAVGVFLFVYALVPATYGTCTWLRRNIIYLNLVSTTPNLTLDQPMISGLGCARNFYLQTEPGIQIGVWHALPRSLSHRCSHPELVDFDFNDTRPVVFHFHGSGGTRGARHRVQLMKTLTESEIDAHVVTLDYRGFGDSTYARVTVAGIVQDVSVLYRWIRQRVRAERIFFWGQSLGTGIAVHLADQLEPEDSPVALVLEAPYTNIADASGHHPYTYLHRFYPFYDAIFANSARHPDTYFDSESRIANVSGSILIMHSQDDETIPYKLGKRLYEVALRQRDPVTQPTEMVTYEGQLRYGHKDICTDPALPGRITEFLKKASTLRSRMTSSEVH